MGCKGVQMTPETVASLFNAELVFQRGYSLMERNDFDGDPEWLRALVERHLQDTSPGVRVGFWDQYAEMRIETPDREQSYCLLIEDGRALRSSACH